MDDIRTLNLRWADGPRIKGISHAVPADAPLGYGDVTVYIRGGDTEHHIVIPRRALIGMLRALEGSNNG